MSDFFDKPKSYGSNLHQNVACKTCGGDRFVLVQKRRPQQSSWMRDHGIKPRSELLIDEYSACPDCNPADTSFWRHDRSRAEALDPAKVRQLMESAPPNSPPTPPAEARIQVDKILKDMT